MLQSSITVFRSFIVSKIVFNILYKKLTELVKILLLSKAVTLKILNGNLSRSKLIVGRF